MFLLVGFLQIIAKASSFPSSSSYSPRRRVFARSKASSNKDKTWCGNLRLKWLHIDPDALAIFISCCILIGACAQELAQQTKHGCFKLTVLFHKLLKEGYWPGTYAEVASPEFAERAHAIWSSPAGAAIQIQNNPTLRWSAKLPYQREAQIGLNSMNKSRANYSRFSLICFGLYRPPLDKDATTAFCQGAEP